MTNATIMEIANKRSIVVLITLVFILAASCLAEKPIANYCLYMEEKVGYLKFESIIDSSVFAKMEEHNIWQIDSEEEKVFKAYFVKIENRDNITCLTSEFIFREYNFLIKNINLKAYSNLWEGHDRYGFSGCIDCPSEETSSVVYQLDATTEFVIDFPNHNLTSVEDFSKLNEIKSSFGDTIPVSWKFKIVCPPHRDTTIAGSYFVRITGECKKK